MDEEQTLQQDKAAGCAVVHAVSVDKEIKVCHGEPQITEAN